MQESALHGAKARDDQVYGRAGRPCPRCGDAIRARGQGDANRLDVLVPGMPAMTRPKRIGHKGADKIAPGNTLASFDAALEHGVDMIEFDVLPERLDGSGRLLLAHDYLDASRRDAGDARGGARRTSRRRAYNGIELDVDMKLPGLRAARRSTRCASTASPSAR